MFYCRFLRLTSETVHDLIFKILWTFFLLYFCNKHVTILHLSLQLSCFDMCKILTWSDQFYSNRNSQSLKNILVLYTITWDCILCVGELWLTPLPLVCDIVALVCVSLIGCAPDVQTGFWGHINKSTGFWGHMKYKQLSLAKNKMSVETCDIWKHDLRAKNILPAEGSWNFYLQKVCHLVPPEFVKKITKI